MIKNLYCALSCCALLILTGCGGGSSGGSGATAVTPTPPVAVTTGELYGFIVDHSNGKPIANAQLSFAGNVIVSGADGSFSFDKLNNQTSVLHITAERYSPHTSNIVISASRPKQGVKVEMQVANFMTTFDPLTAQTLSDIGTTAAVILPANSLVASGNIAPTGLVTAKITVIDPMLMPGDYSTNDGKKIQSFGAINVEFFDASNKALNLVSGKIALIRIPANGGGASLPVTSPLYYFDIKTGTWTKEGSAQLQGSGATAYYEGSVTHFSTWNADDEINTVTLGGRVTDANGAILGGIKVYALGVDYAGRSEIVTDAAGNFTLPVKSNSKLEIVAILNDIESKPIFITTTAANQSLASPIVMPATAFSSISLGNTFARIDKYVYTYGGQGVEIQLPFETKGVTLDWDTIKAGLTEWEITPEFSPADATSKLRFWLDGTSSRIFTNRIDTVSDVNKGIVSFTGTLDLSQALISGNQSSVSFYVSLVIMQKNSLTGGFDRVKSPSAKVTISLIRAPTVGNGLTWYPLTLLNGQNGGSYTAAVNFCTLKGYRLATVDEATWFINSYQNRGEMLTTWTSTVGTFPTEPPTQGHYFILNNATTFLGSDDFNQTGQAICVK